MIKLALFASGNGSNAQRIAEYFRNSGEIRIELILSNKPDAFVLERAFALGIPSVVFNREDFYTTHKVTPILKQKCIDWIILAGFLWMIPQDILEIWSGRIINIHPALLPSYGGKGMYGMKVHEAVISAGETESGITIHHVNDKYDEGEIIFQAKCPVLPGDTAESLAAKVHQLEYEHFPRVIETVIRAQSANSI